MMRFAYLVSAGLCLFVAPALLSAQPLPPVELTVNPWNGEVRWPPVPGTTVLAIEDPAHGEAWINSDGSVSYLPIAKGEFWSVGSDQLIVTVQEPDDSVTHYRLIVRASSPVEGPPTTHFEPGEDPPMIRDDAEQLSIEAAGALLGQQGALIVLDGSGEPAYIEYQVGALTRGDSNNTDAGCADLRMALGTPGTPPGVPGGPGPRNLEGCGPVLEGSSVCHLGLLSAVSTIGDVELFRVEAGLSDTETLLRGLATDRHGFQHATQWVAVSDRPHEIRLDWWTGNDGGLRLRVDGRVRSELRGVDSVGLKVRTIQVGAPINPVGATMTLAVDAVTVRNGNLLHESENITADPFEVDLAGWHSIGEGAGDLTVTSAAALGGDAGLQIDLSEGWGAWMLDRTPAGERKVGLRFRLNADRLTMEQDDTLNLVLGHPTDGPGVEARFLVRLWQAATELRIRASAHDNEAAQHHLPYVSLPSGDHRVELLWQAASEPGRVDGRLQMFLDGQFAGELTELNNDTVAIESIRFGAMYLNPGTTDVLILDEFDSWTGSELGDPML